MSKKKADRTKALLEILAITVLPLGLLILIVGAAAGMQVAVLGFGTLIAVAAALVVFSIIRRRNNKS